MVASGRTNKDIAAALFLSEKTIESHLARIYNKLDIHSRAALTAVIAAPVTDAHIGGVRRSCTRHRVNRSARVFVTVGKSAPVLGADLMRGQFITSCTCQLRRLLCQCFRRPRTSRSPSPTLSEAPAGIACSSQQSLCSTRMSR